MQSAFLDLLVNICNDSCDQVNVLGKVGLKSQNFRGLRALDVAAMGFEVKGMS